MSPPPCGAGSPRRPLQPLAVCSLPPALRPSAGQLLGRPGLSRRGRRGRTVMVSGPTLQGLPRLGARPRGPWVVCVSPSFQPPSPNPCLSLMEISRAWGLSRVSKA